MKMLEQELNMYITFCNRNGLEKGRAVLIEMIEKCGLINYVEKELD
tara:strand:+ start:3280 stop:3417 length:138 start_codon:yes stop_codon:yes gene_type:complete